MKANLIENSLPIVLEKIFTEPDELLIEVIADRVERICGYKPDTESIIKFLLVNYKANIPVVTHKPIAVASRRHDTKDQLHKKLAPDNHAVIGQSQYFPIESIKEGGWLVGTKPRSIRIDQDEFGVANWADVDLKVVRWLASAELLKSDHLPVLSSKNKYFLNKKPVQPDGKDAHWKEAVPGIFVDVKYNAPHHVRNILNVLDKVKASCKVSVLLAPERS